MLKVIALPFLSFNVFLLLVEWSCMCVDIMCSKIHTACFRLFFLWFFDWLKCFFFKFLFQHKLSIIISHLYFIYIYIYIYLYIFQALKIYTTHINSVTTLKKEIWSLWIILFEFRVIFGMLHCHQGSAN